MYCNKNVIVYGSGISGQGAARVLAKEGWRVFLYDDQLCEISPELEKTLFAASGRVVCGNFPKLIGSADLMVLSPGIPVDSDNVRLAENSGMEVISEIELAYRIYKGSLIAITGTNGKTTTTTIIGEMLKKLSVPSAIGGNIGLSLSEEAERLPKDSWLAAEVSSFQLERVRSFAPDIAVVLNLTPDHLERHHTMDAYAAAKKLIFAQQTAEQVTVLNYDDSVVRQWADECKGQICYFSRKTALKKGVFIQDGNFVVKWKNKVNIICGVGEVHLFGGHNEENILAAIACGFFAGVTSGEMAEVLRDFQGVEHRLEYVTTIKGVRYYNDSKATNTDSTIKALQAFKNGHVILLAGGHDKMTDLNTLMSAVKEKTDMLILLGEAKERFHKAALECGVKNIILADSFKDAVQKAYDIAKEPQVVLLSPGCSSYDMFKNYPERGRYFKQLVMALSS
ncbi:MAG: UDP-N-acetylmuramoyl-L-alanine--D-glutamate ligase [Phascolarctobacterium sp.]|nr:UDP-N-acetylmuramoyl-L-alanine--D-glutamate ligase [Phascolarctobacterium sp.]